MDHIVFRSPVVILLFALDLSKQRRPSTQRGGLLTWGMSPPRSELVKSMVFQGFKFAQCVLSPHLDIKKIVKPPLN